MKSTLSLLLTAIILLSVPVLFSACSNKDIVSGTADVVSGAQSVLLGVKAVAPEGDPRVVKLQAFVDLAGKFQSDLASALTPDQQVHLLPLSTALLEAFQTDVLPLLHVSTSVGIAIAGIDAGLRIVANHFKSLEANAPTIAKVGASRAAAARGVDVAAAKATIDLYLSTPRVKKPKG